MDEATLDVLEVLGNRVRMEIVIGLYHGDKSAVDFAFPLEITTTAVIKHLKILENVGLITRKKVGRRNMCSLSKEALLAISAWPELLDVSWLDLLTLEGK